MSSGLLRLDRASYETNFMAPFLQIIHVSWAPPFNINDADSASTQPSEERCSVSHGHDDNVPFGFWFNEFQA